MHDNANGPIRRDSDQVRGAAELATIPYAAALLDQDGRIEQTNQIWRNLALRGGASALMQVETGSDYLSHCARALGPTGLTVSRGLSDLLSGLTTGFEHVYRWHSPTALRWSKVEARRNEGPARGVTIIHVDVTESHMANARLKIQMSVSRAFNARMTMLAACRELAIRVCEELDWDYAGVWTVDVAAWKLRCVDAWVRPELDLGDFERASRAAALGPGSGLPGRAWSTAKVQWATELDSAPHLVPSVAPGAEGTNMTRRIMPPSSISAGLRTALAFPLKCGDDVLAVVDVFSRVRRTPDHALMDLLEVAGDQIALWELRERADQCARVAQHEADEARSQLESVLDCAPAFVIALDKAGAIRFLNKTEAPTRREEVIGTHWKSFVQPEGHTQVERALETVLSTGTPQTYQVRVPGPHGGASWFANYMGPMRSGDSITGAVIISQDVTEARSAQAELADAQRLAAVGTLAAGVAHEINTPVQFVSDSIHFLRDAVGDVFGLIEALRAVKSAAEEGADPALLRAALEQAEQAEEQADLAYLLEHMPKACERSIDGLERVATIVRSMKEFAHPAQKEMAPADLNRAITSTLTVARNEYKYVAALELELGVLPPVTCHLNEINQVVLNIVVNAAHAIADLVKGTENKGRITIRTMRDGPHAVIAISDTGGGIPLHAQPHIFEPFYTTKEVGRGTGQGLSMAWSAIKERHAGELSFETRPSEGTTFIIKLPIAGKPTRDAAPEGVLLAR